MGHSRCRGFGCGSASCSPGLFHGSSGASVGRYCSLLWYATMLGCVITASYSSSRLGSCASRAVCVEGSGCRMRGCGSMRLLYPCRCCYHSIDARGWPLQTSSLSPGHPCVSGSPGAVGGTGAGASPRPRPPGCLRVRWQKGGDSTVAVAPPGGLPAFSQNLKSSSATQLRQSFRQGTMPPTPATVMPLSTNQPLLLSLSRWDRKYAWAPLATVARAEWGSQCRLK